MKAAVISSPGPPEVLKIEEALLPGGGYAEYAAVNGGHCLPLPRGLSFEEGAALRSREARLKSILAAEVERNVWPRIEAGKFRANVFKALRLDEAAEAHRLMQASRHIGKIVLAVQA